MAKLPRFEEQNVSQIGSVDTGFQSASQQLQSKLEDFKRLGFQVVERGAQENIAKAREAGQVEGLKEQPEKREVGFFSSRADKAFNQALRDSYVSSVNTDNRNTINRFATENPDDLLAYNNAINSYREGLKSELSPEAAPLLLASFDDMAESNRIQVQGRETAKVKAETVATRKVEISEAGLLAAQMARAGDAIGSATQIQLAALTYNSLVESGDIDANTAAVAIRELEREATEQTWRYRFNESVQSDNGIAKAALLIEDLSGQTLKGFTPDEQDQLISSLETDLNQSIQLQDTLADQSDADLEALQEVNGKNLYLGVLNGEVDVQAVKSAIRNNQIDFSMGEKLIGKLTTQGQGTDNPALINIIQDDIRNNSVPASELRASILANQGVNLTSQTAGELLNELDQSMIVESPLQTNNAKRAEQYIISSVRVSGPFGALDENAERRLAKSRREFSRRVLQGEDPFLVADVLIEKDRFQKLPRPKFGTKQNLDDAMRLLDDAFDKGEIDDVTYNSQFRLIEELNEITQNEKEFNALLRESQRGQ